MEAGKIHLGHVYCETLEPTEEAGESEMRYAPAGYKFALPIHDILSAKGGYFQAKDRTASAACRAWLEDAPTVNELEGKDGLFVKRRRVLHPNRVR